MSAPIGDRDYAYSSCPECGTDNDPLFTNGATATAEQNWATYVCGGAGKGSANDGCGRNWAVTTARGLEHNEAMGTHTLGRVPIDVGVQRFVSAPSDAYRSNYARVFGHE